MVRRTLRLLQKSLSYLRGPYDEYARLMQMSSKERKYIDGVIQGKQFLEIGSGYSTVWFSKYANRIVSVETRKEWFFNVKAMLNKHGITNVEVCLLEPEACAYDELGREKWNNRMDPTGSDYGTPEEFSQYLLGIQELLNKNHFDVVLVDANVRGLIIEYMCRQHYQGRILLHDVMPERAYLNDPILAMDNVLTVAKIDSLVELRCLEAPDSH